VAIVTAASAITVSTAAQNTNNNMQAMTVNNPNTQSYNATPKGRGRLCWHVNLLDYNLGKVSKPPTCDEIDFVEFEHADVCRRVRRLGCVLLVFLRHVSLNVTGAAGFAVAYCKRKQGLWLFPTTHTRAVHSGFWS
jgi:hypothetical protein